MKTLISNSHLLTLRSNIPRSLHNPLPSIMMLIKLISKTFKHIMEPSPRARLFRAGRVLSTSIAVAVSLNSGRHCDRFFLTGAFVV